ncbi:MAG: ROK family protein [Lachnospiraceae bacterium]|nr:ROK family protein [Lachnospiraceae bacterium]
MKQYIAIDIGGTNIKYGVVSQNGEVLSNLEKETSAFAKGEELLKFLADIVALLRNDETAGIGVATLGAVDEESGCVIGMCDNYPVIKGLPLAGYLKEKTGLPVSVMNDVNTTALGEAGFGAGRGLSTFFCMTLGTGIGGAYVHNGEVISGIHGIAGEIGYLWSGQGERYENLASAKRFSEECRRLGNHEEKALLPALNGDPVYAELLERWIRDVALGIADVIYILDPGTFIIGGAVSETGKPFTDRIEKSLEEILYPDFRGKTRILPAENGNVSNMLGAIYPFIKQ